MARTFRSRRSAQPIAELNVTNLIDLGFMLLIIFMVVTPLMQQEQTIPVNLPTVAKTPQSKPERDDRFVAVGVDSAGRFYIDNRNVPVTLDVLRSRLRAYAGEPKPPIIRIRGDAEVPYQKVAELFNEVERAGLVRFTIDSQAED
jgi:biopolymer transport protein ExbD